MSQSRSSFVFRFFISLVWLRAAAGEPRRSGSRLSTGWSGSARDRCRTGEEIPGCIPWKRTFLHFVPRVWHRPEIAAELHNGSCPVSRFGFTNSLLSTVFTIISSGVYWLTSNLSLISFWPPSVLVIGDASTPWSQLRWLPRPPQKKQTIGFKKGQKTKTPYLARDRCVRHFRRWCWQKSWKREEELKKKLFRPFSNTALSCNGSLLY